MNKDYLTNLGMEKLANEIKPIEKVKNKFPDFKFKPKNVKIKSEYKKGVKNELPKLEQRSGSNLFSKSGRGSQSKSFGGYNSGNS
jgi:predicted RNA-binding protein Jag